MLLNFSFTKSISSLIKKSRIDSHSKVVFVSIPKCGTHFLLRYFDYVGFKHGGPYNATSFESGLNGYVRNLREGFYSAYHYPWSEELSDLIKAKKIKVVFLYRDPRAQLISRFHFIMKTPHHRQYPLLAQHFKTSKERIASLIEGFDIDQARFSNLNIYEQAVDLQNPVYDTIENRSNRSRGIKKMYGSYYKWLQDPSCFSLRFEDIIGPKGGGSKKKQLEVIRKLMRFTGTPKGELNPREVADALYDENSNTFRKGQIDSWRKDFTPELHELFMKKAGELLGEWGYLP